MSGLPIAARLDRTRLAGLADNLVVAVAFVLPLSTPAIRILLMLWPIALIPTLEWPDVRPELATPAGGLLVLLFALGAIGMAWSDMTWSERRAGLDSSWKFLIIPLLMTQSNKHHVFIGFLISCVLLLLASYVAIKLGLSGIAVLWAIWIAHLLLFRGPGLIAWIGLVVVTQNVVGSLFNSFLVDYTEGWLYVLVVGVAVGMLRQLLAAGAGPPDGRPAQTSPP